MTSVRSGAAAFLSLALLGGATAAAQGLPRARPEETGLSGAALQRVRPMLQAYVDSGKLGGIVAAVARHGKLAYLEAVGPMDRATGAPVRTDAVFRICSMTKPVTAAAVLQLADRGRLKVEDPVSKYIPAFASVKLFAGGSASAPVVRAPDAPITIEHLLMHTGGLTYGPFGSTPVDSIYNKANLFGVPSMAQLADSVAHLPTLASPGTKWNYGMGLDVLGRVIEVVSGKPFDRYVEEELFVPLGMHDTGFHLKPGMAGRLPMTYTAGTGGQIQPMPNDVCGDYRPEAKVFFGGSGLLSTVPDYLRFAQMLLNGGELDGHRVLQRETVTRMMTNHLPGALTPIDLSGLGKSNYRGYGQGYGGAVQVDSVAGEPAGAKGIFRWLGYESTFFWVDPRNEVIGIVFTQFLPAGTYPMDKDFQRLVYQAVK